MSKLVTSCLTLLFLVGLTQQQKLDPLVCDCGFTDESNMAWTDVWHADFSKYPVDIGLDNNYAIHSYTTPAKHENTIDRVYGRDNAAINNGVLELTVRNNNGVITNGALSTSRSDFLYGSFRANIQTTDVDGTVAAFYMYKDDENEIDMETLSYLKNPAKVYVSVKPQIYNADGSASEETLRRQEVSFQPSDGFHEYRFDWFPGKVEYFIDGQSIGVITTNVPQQPGKIIFNHWTDGNAHYGQGPPDRDAVLKVANLTVFFNTTSGAVPACSQMAASCSVSGKTWSI
ncbi:hypothetical protein INT43_008162, partial [Umbelopsis isabellina]